MKNKVSSAKQKTLTPTLPRRERRVKKVLIALSGGIDSAVSAYLLIKKGYEVEAAFMKNWSSTEGLLKNDCPWLQDRQDALRVAAFLRIPLYTIDFEDEYQKRVMKYFFEEYKKGRTPNPDVMCNKEIKFKLLYNWAMRRGFDYLATGHYAKIGLRAKGIGLSFKDLALSPSPYTLERSADEFKDQTYFIYNIKPEQLPHLMFPIGGMKKTAVRSLARKIGLPNAEKRESMGLCFVGKIRLKDFLEQKLNEKPGKIIDQAGKTIGEHPGLHNFTIGQRQGINIGSGGPYYVVRKDLKRNRLYVTNKPEDEALMVKEVAIHSVNWINKNQKPRISGADLVDSNVVCEPELPSNKMLSQRKNYVKELFFSGGPEGICTPGAMNGNSGFALRPAHCEKLYHSLKVSARLLGRFRHQGQLVPLTLEKNGRGTYKVHFSHPQKAVASGQSLVLYDGKICVGGGIIV